MNKKCLFLKASSAACAAEEQTIRASLQGFNVDVDVVEWLSLDDFESQVSGKQFHIIYLGAHADGSGFGERGHELHNWDVLANAICRSQCMVPEGTLFLGCCRGGMKTVAFKILRACNKIDYIIGPNWNAKGGDLAAAFSAFARSHLADGEEPTRIAERTSCAAGQRFNCYDRQDLEAEIEIIQQLWSIERGQNEIRKDQKELMDHVACLLDSVREIQRQLSINPQSIPETDEYDEIIRLVGLTENCCPEPPLDLEAKK